MTRTPKLITILGPTACGKSALGIELAQEFDGEIVSADSRQVYRGLDIGTGKVTAEERALVPHHLLDVVEPPTTPSPPPPSHSVAIPLRHPPSPRLRGTGRAGGDILFSVADYQQLAFEAIDDIIKRGRHPFLLGGTALYIYAVIDNYRFDSARPNLARRRELEKKSVKELQSIILSSRTLLSSLSSRTPAGGEGSPLAPEPVILSLDVSGDSSPSRLRRLGLGMTESDFRNKRRLIRAIEKLEAGQTLAPKKGPPRYDNLILGIDIPRAELYARIDRRVDARLQQGMIEEVVKLRENSPPLQRNPLLGKSLSRPRRSRAAGRGKGEGGGSTGGVVGGVKIDDWLLNLGLEYRFITEYLQGKWPSQEAMITRLKTASHAFARRQLTWWRRDKRIMWIKNKEEARTVISSDNMRQK